MRYVYILKCLDSVLSAGITDNLERRFTEHQQGQGGHFTAYNRAEKFLYKEPFENKSDAARREKQIKRWSKAKKLALIKITLKNYAL